MMIEIDPRDQCAAAYTLRERARARKLSALSPADFIRDELGEYLWSKQREIADAVQKYRHVAVASAHGVGKSWIASRLIAWWIATRPRGDAFALSTAPSFPQVRAILWRELNKAFVSGNLPGRMNQTEWSIGTELVAMGRKPSDYNEEAFQGIHAKHVLVVLDEACGIPEQLWTAADAIATNEYSRVFAIGNPDDPTSHFARVCDPLSGWHVLHISAFDSPNLSGEEVPDDLHDLLVSKTWVDEREAEWGKSDPRYISKVEGRFPEDAEDGVIPYSWIKACQTPITELDESIVELGFDVAAGGADETVIYERRGMRASRSWHFRIPDTMELVGHVVGIITDSGASAIKIDKIGIGQGVYDRLRELKRQGIINCKVHGVNVATSPSDKTKFPKLRDEIWWMGRELSESGVVHGISKALTWRR